MPPDSDETSHSILAKLGRFEMQKLSPMQQALRQLLVGFSVAIALLAVASLVVRWREMPPRPRLSAGAEVQAVYREQREEAEEDARGDFELAGGFLIATFTALLGYFVGVKHEQKPDD